MAPGILASSTSDTIMAPATDDIKTNASGVNITAMPPASQSNGELREEEGPTLAQKYGWPDSNARGYRILDQHYGALRPMRIIHIGAGASGICFSKFAKDLLQNASWVCYDKNEDIGGTWLENRYP